MKPDIWGKHFWYTIHFIALDYPEEPNNEDKRDFQMFFENLHKVIPCYKCSVNYIKHLNERPLENKNLENNKTLFKWTVDIHNIVNRDLKKKEMSYDDAWRLYHNFGNNLDEKNNTWLIYLVYVLVLIIILMITAYIWRNMNLSKR
tara:strand:+ start:194 stop:631 length:438 start_codon:yes stop_codon:yes gene_type:complete